MGMAAGQARLLSITSRLSDNELRAQIINNNKMRLATESSQVSEAYIAALNRAQMMFTSYDANNNASYEKLSFNTLTAFNPYNNQYALLNSGGQVLLSEKDTLNYENNKNDLEGFLRAYGLEQTTTYFDQFDQVFPTGFPMNWYNSEGHIEGFVVEDGDPPTYLTFTSEQLKAMYEGGEVNIPKIGSIMRAYSEELNAYDTTASSSTMYDYERYLFKYNESDANYLSLIAQAEQDKFLGMLINAFGVTEDEPNLSDVLAKLTGAPGDFDKLREIIGPGSEFRNLLAKDATGEIPDDVAAYLDRLDQMLVGYHNGVQISTIGKVNETNTDNIIWSAYGADGQPLKDDEGNIIADKIAQLTGSFAGGYTGIQYFKEDGTLSSVITLTGGVGHVTVDESGVPIPGTDSDPTIRIGGITGTAPNRSREITLERTMTPEELKDEAKAIIKELTKVISNIWDADSEVWHNDTAPDYVQEAYNLYKENAIQLGKLIFGDGYDGTTPPMRDLGDIVTLYNDYDPTNPFTEDFKQVFCNLILDRVMDSYGEPKYTWIDTSNPSDSYNVNGEAKAKWYTNLFELIEKNGYKTILDGIASSNEWIEFAFENGIVQMKQVDEHNAWNNIIYSNCSDIFEQTDDKAIAIAEAEYNAAMNKIENKDKRYDLELKNIDTEHNSLQVEYDSIKTAIDKNIERNFKLYS